MWLNVGFDETFKMPLIKVEFLIRIKSLLKLRDDSESEYKIIFQNINLGIYKMSVDKKIITANRYFMSLLGVETLQDINHHDFFKLSEFNKKNRTDLIATLNEQNNHVKREFEWFLQNTKLYLNENIYFIKKNNIVSYVGTIEDYTARKESEMSLASNEKKYRQLIEFSPYGIVIVQNGKTKFVNNSFVKLLKAKEKKDLIDITINDFVHPDYQVAVLNRIKNSENERIINEKFEEKFICYDKSVIDVEVVSCSIIYEGYPAVQATINDISDRLKSKEIIDHLAYHDPLTNIYNRNKFETIVSSDLEIAKKNNTSVAILFIDLDHFKNINDTLGHLVGDALLIEVAKRLAMNVSKYDSVGRLGGDEFVIELVSYNNTYFDIEKSIQAIVNSLVKPFLIEHNELTVTASIGISIFPKDGLALTTLFKNADIAMYSAKQKGRNNYQYCSLELTSIVDEKVKLENEFRLAINHKNLYLKYQPKLCLKTNSLIGVEALVRWKHPSLGEIPPSKFIPIAEECGLITLLTEFVLDESCKQISEWTKHNLSIKVAVNLSVKDFQSGNLFNIITNSLNKYNVCASLLEVEITESLFMQDIDQSSFVLKQLNNLGITISIDDFGTGYSSLSYLRSLMINTLKIDASFIRDLLTDANDVAIVIAVIAMAHSLKLTVIAEGVENIEQLNLLRSFDCDQIQGYYFCHPVIASELFKFALRFTKPV
jgi:diguanylate cyclase (GGDEF)-like protein/PAS domain S-box-containing protein